MKQMILFLVLFISLFFEQSLSCSSDEIKELPGLCDKINFKQYSGYLDGGKGKKLFYWFVESQSKPSEDPVTLWLNGGPGCSSLGAFFTAHGPFRVDADGKTLKLDQYSWNTMANMLYLESPVNVGFSYNSTPLDAADLYNDIVSIDAKYYALIDFFRKFPNFKKNKFYITGESYAGVYIPLLTRKILENRQTNGFNFQGISIGNGFIDSLLQASSHIEFGYYHGLFSIDQYNQIQDVCCKTDEDRLHHTCDFAMAYPNYTLKVINNNVKCKNMVGSLLQDVRKVVDLYNVYDSCDYEGIIHLDYYCINRKYYEYLNQASVREAIHVDPSLKDRNWIQCNEYVRSNYNNMHETMAPVFSDIIKKHKFNNIILYNGDVDMACDFITAQRFLLYRLKYKQTGESKHWFTDGRFSGFSTFYENGIRFFTVHGAGHKAPIQKPKEGLAILKNLLDFKKD